MAYTVVRFIEENEEEEIISEVPSSWIESDHCWWPSSKNVSILISKGVCPDKNKWRKYLVAVLGVAGGDKSNMAKILLELQSLNTTGMTNNLNLEDDDFQSIISTFPIDNVDVLKEINSRVERDLQSYKKVVLYFKSIGGITLKEKIFRVLKRALSNKLIAQASWLGHSRGDRLNFQLSNLKLIAAIKDAVNTDMSYTEKEFEKIAADWTRQGKQRKQREQKNKQ